MLRKEDLPDGPCSSSPSVQLAFLPSPADRVEDLRRDFPRRQVGGGEAVPARADEFDPLGLVTQGDARDSEVEGLLLQPAGIGGNDGGVRHESHHVEIARGWEQSDGRLGDLDHRAAECCPCPRVDREDDPNVSPDFPQSFDEPTEASGVVRIRRPMNGDEDVRLRRQPQPGERLVAFRDDVADP